MSQKLKHGDLIRVDGDAERAYSTYKVAVSSKLGYAYREGDWRKDQADYPFATLLPTVITAWREPAPVIAAFVQIGDDVEIEGLTCEYIVAKEHNGHIKFIATDPALAARQAAERKRATDEFYAKNSETYLSQ